ncbi:MAG: hypothetical protein NC483_06390 [Ruminococcus sp.]|nr:hypothetical protein [Ruminococcus sp.]
MKKKKFVYIISITVLLFICIIGVKALGTNSFNHQIKIEGVLCSKDLYPYEDAYDIFEACKVDYMDGKLNDYILDNNSEISPGAVVLFVEKYVYGGVSEIEAYTSKINYNPNYWRNNEYEGEEEFLSYYNREGYPTSGRNYKWNDISIDSLKPGEVTAYGSADNSIVSLNDNINLFMFALILKDDAPAGTRLSVSLNKDYSYLLKLENKNLEKKSYTIKDLTLRVAGNNSYIDNIVSNEYKIDRDGETPIVYGAEPKTTIKEFINNFENEEKLLSIYDKNGELITDYSRYIGSYMTIKLIDNEEEKDSLTVVVKGDFDGNGIVENSERIYINYYLLGRVNTSFLAKQIGDINLDGKVTISDVLGLVNYLVDDTNSLNNIK